MKKTLLIIILIFCCGQYAAAGPGTMVVGGAAPVAGSTPDPVLQLDLEDNTTGNTVVATYGSNAAVINVTNTSDISSTEHIEGSRSFQLQANDGIAITSFTDSWFTDEIFTIELKIKGSGVGGWSNAYCRFIETSNTNAITMIRNNSDTSIRLYLGGTLIGDFTVTDIDNTQWHTLRLVVNGTNDVCMYEKIDSGSWSSGICDDTDPGDITTVGTTIEFYNSVAEDKPWGQDGGGYYVDQIIIWNSAVTP